MHLLQEIGRLLDFVSNNQLISSVFGTALVGLIAWLWKINVDRMGRNRIYEYLLKSSSSSDWTFRSTHAIAAATKLTEERVEVLCIQHPKIKRNEMEKQTWRLAD